MSRYQEELVGRIKDSTDLVSLVESYIPLRKRGKSFVALCPFHEEKTPSFSVSPERQSFKCFGCGKGGDALTFLQEYEKIGFLEALESLADRAGIPLERGAAGAGPDPKTVFRKANEFALDYFSGNLETAEGQVARDYLAGRGISRETSREFRLGFAPPGWERLKAAARKAGVEEFALEGAGLLVRNDRGGLYDRFRNRLVIPIFDILKRVVGFGARVMDGSEPKYLNSPETVLFAKGSLLYGLERVREGLAQGQGSEIGIVEGYTDVILAYQAGVRNLVATLGTALTREHARGLRRYTSAVALVFDGDEAGQKANARGVEILLEEDLDVSVVVLPEGLDPGDLVQRRGAPSLREALSRQVDFFDFSLGRLTNSCDMRTVAGRAKAVDEMLALVRRVTSPVKRELLFPRIADRLGVAERALRERYAGLVAPPSGVERKGAPAGGARSSEDRLRGIEEELLAVLLKDPSVLPFVRESLGPDGLRGEGRVAVYRAMLRMYEEEGTIRAGRIAELAGEACRTEILRWGEMVFEEPAKTAAQLVRALLRRRHEERIGRLKQEARAARKAGDESTVDARHVEISRLLKDSRIAHG